MINPAFHQFLLDENKALRVLLRKLYEERQHMQCELLDLRDILKDYEYQEARSFRGFGAARNKDRLIHTND